MRRWLDRSLRRRPQLLHGFIGGTLGACGDAIAQTIERRRPGAAALGAFFSGLVYPRVYAVLDARWPGTTARAVCSKTAADIALLGTVGNSFSIGCRLRIGGEQLPEVLVALRDTMPAVLLNELRVWLPYNLLAFRLVPTPVRPATTSLVTLCWQVYISWTAHHHQARVA
ncbi:hypothetical protein EMIHUDRAFT_449480 [Emiliania huxleyi CCMP1516]|uniref:Peroxisomal membrane protein MPV17 n=2 Tax=Emiliania huxleyi TaxID=2903 RepID=A0A0D3K8D9_EMIH1|nr:hypothetical protein EMIHUDRAFT_459209 [Emiliania huxleyi CCMP1516]XP_005784453.1 hypothetical protein EMIHUDRAFT_449480 [Emiliania huxleyi CCMP1516]EOD16111.1 hypothetical protein EMIHUDRAFT_459209 [Emiliania huxleyi CCMP1516]EOD32024.1 hypothetical protein EMIHUDRAFT_449480 [Emiliania huxleyi CCMP1516]|eukprot:XP_005768540.1 hypothetical protein EMIHUDRAFT_459209 [Emiliania huxleyi CCMP1516]